MFSDKLVSFLSSVPSEAATFIIGMTPISELRGAIPVAVGVYHMNIWEAFFWAALGNVFVAALVVIFLEKIAVFLSKHFLFWKKFFDWLFERTRKRAQDKIEKYGMWGLFVLVAIPLPMTGGWTGAIAAFIFGIPKKKAIGVISLGVIAAGVIISVLTVGVKAFN